MTLSAFSDELANVRTKKKEFLSQIDRIVPWGEWMAEIKPCDYKGERGNKPYDLERVLRIYMLQNLYDLSDMGTVAEVIDSRAFSSFCGVDSSNQVPDGDTLGQFRHILEENGIQQKRFARVVRNKTNRRPSQSNKNSVRSKAQIKRREPETSSGRAKVEHGFGVVRGWSIAIGNHCDTR